MTNGETRPLAASETGVMADPEAVAARYAPVNATTEPPQARRATDEDRRLLEDIDAAARLSADMTFSALLTALNASRVTLLGEASYDAGEIAHVRQLAAMGDHVAKLRFARDRALYDTSRGRG